MREINQRHFLKIARVCAAATLFAMVLVVTPLSGDGKPLQSTATPPTASSAQRPKRLNIGSSEGPSVTLKVQPVYPPDAMAAHVSGTVVLRAIIATDGSVQKLDVVSGPHLLLQAAKDAVRQWTFEPTLLNGEAVEVDTKISVVFNLGESRQQQDQNVPDPWTAEQTVAPEALAKEISGPAASKPTIACVGFHVLYDGGHIPGASYHGPGRSDEGLADLKKWADALPRSTNVVLYCGCCPLTHCPNLRPAFSALRAMGFTHVRAAIMPTNFATDWADKGFPVEKGK